jgi:16S rRNA (guanine527-N7)-methyltransferase
MSDKKLLDIGAGAGFPSIPFLIYNPKIKLTIYEPLNKRCIFLEVVKERLNLNFKINKVRSEESTENNFYDFVTARAVAPLKALIEISYNVGNLNCKFIFFKGKKFQEEITEAHQIMKKLNIKISAKMIKNDSDRKIIIIKYIKETIKKSFKPRHWALIKKDFKK